MDESFPPAAGVSEFLRTIEAVVPTDLDIHSVHDNYGAPLTLSIRDWFARHSRFHVHFMRLQFPD
jgi:hypothetical protein